MTVHTMEDYFINNGQLRRTNLLFQNSIRFVGISHIYEKNIFNIFKGDGHGSC
ncbi:hypothetical protein DES35_10616 [Schleiferia thermophila]|uniref:Uncharacterized protein n=1 Tax=Schleiferia thermophila TaxID=884107 RepID=A0A369A1G2_9FLAO|nr:hypothetical protein DES35_10616 [Schleiferia thermophila]